MNQHSKMGTAESHCPSHTKLYSLPICALPTTHILKPNSKILQMFECEIPKALLKDQVLKDTGSIQELITEFPRHEKCLITHHEIST